MSDWTAANTMPKSAVARPMKATTCSVSGASDSRLPPLSQSPVTFECPLCGSHGLTTRLSGYSLQLPAWHANAPLLSAATSLPRQPNPWPTANPRAPPVL